MVMRATSLTRDTLTEDFRRYGTTGIPWVLIDDTLCHPPGAYRQLVETMLRGGELAEDDGRVRLASFPPMRSPRNRHWINVRDRLIDILKAKGVPIETRCASANRVMSALFGPCPPMTVSP